MSCRWQRGMTVDGTATFLPIDSLLSYFIEVAYRHWVIETKRKSGKTIEIGWLMYVRIDDIRPTAATLTYTFGSNAAIESCSHDKQRFFLRRVIV